MKEIVTKATVGLRSKKTHEIVAVYPNLVEGLNQEVEKMVKDWYYVQGCANEETLRHCFVDILRENELH
ncbi:MAG: hypothetical protein A2Y23_12600 [Clostridiales bacterium GWB2_37_7]|nr:MAG: hypothetical protein A2Y23_12600 [Clostridiales bacterium GWB2_37_7]